MAQWLPKISIVIATWNRSAILKRCVESICAQDYPKKLMELIIVNDGSTDNTLEYLSTMVSQESWIKVISQSREWQAGARNRGLALASGDLVAITDDDCVVARDWLSTMAAAMQDQHIAAIGGHVEATGSSLVAGYLNHIRLLDPPMLPDGTPQYVVTANCCLRRSILNKVGFYNEVLGSSTGEEAEFSTRMRRKGMKLKYVPACRVDHWYEPDVTLFMRRSYRYGLGSRHVFDLSMDRGCWIPRADLKLQALFNTLSHGTVSFRAFREVEEPGLRSWYSMLFVLQQISYLSGYLCIKNIEQLLSLQPLDQHEQEQKISDWIPAKPVDVRRLQAKEIFQALSADTFSGRLESRQEGYETGLDWNILTPLEADKLSFWISSILNTIGVDVLLELASSYFLPHTEPGIPDIAISPIRSSFYKYSNRRRARASMKKNRALLRQLSLQPGRPTLARIEELCYANSIDVNRFLSWYGNISDVGDRRSTKR